MSKKPVKSEHFEIRVHPHIYDGVYYELWSKDDESNEWVVSEVVYNKRDLKELAHLLMSEFNPA